MNERIKELIGQCHRPVLTYNKQYLGEAFDHEKFAELIIRECMFVTRQCAKDIGIRDQFADEIIAKHFGVE